MRHIAGVLRLQSYTWPLLHHRSWKRGLLLLHSACAGSDTCISGRPRCVQGQESSVQDICGDLSEALTLAGQCMALLL